MAEPNTAIARQKGVRRFSAWLADEGEVEIDPLLGLKRPTEVRKVVEALDDDQLRRLFDACKGKTFTHRRDEAVVRLLAETGARAGEVIDLGVADVDLGRGRAVVRRGKGGKGCAVLACRIADEDRWCRRCGEEGIPRDSVTRQLAHEPFGWRPTTLLVTIRRYRCAGCALCGDKTPARPPNRGPCCPGVRCHGHWMPLFANT